MKLQSQTFLINYKQKQCSSTFTVWNPERTDIISTKLRFSCLLEEFQIETLREKNVFVSSSFLIVMFLFHCFGDGSVFFLNVGHCPAFKEGRCFWGFGFIEDVFAAPWNDPQHRFAFQCPCVRVYHAVTSALWPLTRGRGQGTQRACAHLHVVQWCLPYEGRGMCLEASPATSQKPCWWE